MNTRINGFMIYQIIHIHHFSTAFVTGPIATQTYRNKDVPLSFSSFLLSVMYVFPDCNRSNRPWPCLAGSLLMLLTHQCRRLGVSGSGSMVPTILCAVCNDATRGKAMMGFSTMYQVEFCSTRFKFHSMLYL